MSDYTPCGVVRWGWQRLRLLTEPLTPHLGGLAGGVVTGSVFWWIDEPLTTHLGVIKCFTRR